jgi:hypothetical protein
VDEGRFKQKHPYPSADVRPHTDEGV